MVYNQVRAVYFIITFLLEYYLLLIRIRAHVVKDGGVTLVTLQRQILWKPETDIQHKYKENQLTDNLHHCLCQPD